MKVKIRADSVEIEGYVNAVGRDSRLITDENGYRFKEQMEPGVFGRALSAAADKGSEIALMLDHSRTIGGTDSNLKLEEDSIGLHARAEVTDPDTIQAAREKRLSGWSFGFRELDYKEGYGDDFRRRTVTELDLVEVSIIDDQMTPAYAGTSIHARAESGEKKLFTRAFDDNIEYLEESETAPQAEEEKETPPEAHEEQDKTPDTPKEQTETRAENKDYPRYINRIRVLRLGR